MLNFHPQNPNIKIQYNKVYYKKSQIKIIINTLRNLKGHYKNDIDRKRGQIQSTIFGLSSQAKA